MKREQRKKEEERKRQRDQENKRRREKGEKRKARKEKEIKRDQENKRRREQEDKRTKEQDRKKEKQRKKLKKITKPKNPPDELSHHDSKKKKHRQTELFGNFSSKVQNLTLFSINSMIRIRFSGSRELIWKAFSGA